MTFLPLLADRILNRPLYLAPNKLAAIALVLRDRLDIDANGLRELAASAPVQPHASQYIGRYEPVDPNDPNGPRKPYRTTGLGTAIIPVVGSLVNRASWIDAYSGITGYDRLKREIGMAARDTAVHAIVLDIDSPGGEAVGAAEVADVVQGATIEKNVIAVANGLCCSAAYKIASGASQIVVTPSSLVGSIGVVMLHADHSRRLDKAGIATRLIYAGDRKVDGNPYEPLSDETASELQAEVDRFYDLFIAVVAKGRPKLTPEAIRATEARTFIGADAVEAGLADSVDSFEGVVEALDRISPARFRRFGIGAQR